MMMFFMFCVVLCVFVCGFSRSRSSSNRKRARMRGEEREHKERKLVVLECDDVLEMNIRLYYT